MFNTSLFNGKLVRLAPNSPDDHPTIAVWSTNDEYLRIADDDPAVPVGASAVNVPGSSHDSFGFRIRTLSDDQLIGMVGLFNIKWANRTTNLGIVIGDPNYWGKGYGTDALALIVAYAFRELNLYRVGLDV